MIHTAISIDILKDISSLGSREEGKDCMFFLCLSISLRLKGINYIRLSKRRQGTSGAEITEALKRAGIKHHIAKRAGELYSEEPEIFSRFFLRQAESGMYAIRSLKGIGRRAIFYAFDKKEEEQKLSFESLKPLLGINTRRSLIPVLVSKRSLDRISALRTILQATTLVVENMDESDTLEGIEFKYGKQVSHFWCDKVSQIFENATTPLGKNSKIFSQRSVAVQGFHLGLSKNTVSKLRRVAEEITDVEFVPWKWSEQYKTKEMAEQRAEEINARREHGEKAFVKEDPETGRSTVFVQGSSVMVSNTLERPSLHEFKPKCYYYWKGMLEKASTKEEYQKAEKNLHGCIKRWWERHKDTWHTKILPEFTISDYKDRVTELQTKHNLDPRSGKFFLDAKDQAAYLGSKMFLTKKFKNTDVPFMIYKSGDTWKYWAKGYGNQPVLDPESIIFKAQKGHFQIRDTFVLYDGTFIAYSKDLEELLKSNKENDSVPSSQYSADSEEWKEYLSLTEGADHILHPVGYFKHNREMEIKTIEKAKSIFKNLKEECKTKSPDKKKEAKKFALLKEEEERRAESAEKRTYLRNRMKYEKKSSSNIYLKKVEEFADRYLSHLTDAEKIWMLSNEQAIWKEEFKKYGDILVAKNELFKRIRKAGKESSIRKAASVFFGRKPDMVDKGLYVRLHAISILHGLRYAVEGFEKKEDVSGKRFERRLEESLGRKPHTYNNKGAQPRIQVGRLVISERETKIFKEYLKSHFGKDITKTKSFREFMRGESAISIEGSKLKVRMAQYENYKADLDKADSAKEARFGVKGKETAFHLTQDMVKTLFGNWILDGRYTKRPTPFGEAHPGSWEATEEEVSRRSKAGAGDERGARA